jgi:hypothetical protein
MRKYASFLVQLTGDNFLFVSSMVLRNMFLLIFTLEFKNGLEVDAEGEYQ